MRTPKALETSTMFKIVSSDETGHTVMACNSWAAKTIEAAFQTARIERIVSQAGLGRKDEAVRRTAGEIVLGICLMGERAPTDAVYERLKEYYDNLVSVSCEALGPDEVLGWPAYPEPRTDMARIAELHMASD